MGKLERVKIDSRGRIVLPQHFRELLNLSENTTAYAVLDEDHQSVRITPAEEKNLVFIEILLDDAPGSLAKAADALYRQGVDLVATESHSTLRGQKAVWRIVAKSAKPASELGKKLRKAGVNLKTIRKM
ncbi:hypothetical protein HY572_03195 [Candidatus Micrarchaeota archaeon]|nr:hypothetical protein [Candidatus Micrarchaeota archaeon]